VTSAFSSLGISADLVLAIDRLGWTTPTSIQLQAIPPILAGSDVVGQSATGSGKTGAFCIPAVDRVDPDRKVAQVLILVPTRELAMQVAEEAGRLGAARRGIRTAAIFGGAAYARQFADLERGAQVIVGTPGRIVDHLSRGTLDPGAVGLVVLDEADRMLDMGFRDDIETILAAVPAGRQTVFFSATFPPAIRTLVERHARRPREIRIDGARRSVGVEQCFHEVRHHAKQAALERLAAFHDPRSGLVFCNTQAMVDELADWMLARGFSAERLHGGMAQAQRTRVMEGFKRGAFRWLVATDVAARGIDVDDLELVVNYDLPSDAEDYVHRIGRTGRAGRSGRAVSLVSGGAGFRIGHFERVLAVRIPRQPVPTAGEVAARRADRLVEALRERIAGGLPAHAAVVGRLVAEGHAPEVIAAAALDLLAPSAADAPREEAIDAAPREGRVPRAPPPRHPGKGRPAGPRRYGPVEGEGRPPRVGKKAFGKKVIGKQAFGKQAKPAFRKGAKHPPKPGKD